MPEVGTWAAALAVAARGGRWWSRSPRRTGRLGADVEPGARDQAAQLLPWIVPSAVAQIYGGLVASALAALDDYQWAAFGFASRLGRGVVLTSLSSTTASCLRLGPRAERRCLARDPLAPLVARARGSAARTADSAGRLRELCEGVALPIALQGLYVIALPLRIGPGTWPGDDVLLRLPDRVFPGRYHGVVDRARDDRPFARAARRRRRVARHVVAISWLSLALVAAAAGVFALAGEAVVRRVLGASYGGDIGTELGRLVVYLAPWMVASVAVTVSYPLVFVRGRARWLPPLALRRAPRPRARSSGSRGGRSASPASRSALAVTTALVLAALLVRLDALGSGRARARRRGGGLRRARGARVRAAKLLVGPYAAAVAGLRRVRGGARAWRPTGLRRGVGVRTGDCSSVRRRARARERARPQARAHHVGKNLIHASVLRDPASMRFRERRAVARRRSRLRGSRVPLLVEPAEPRRRVAAVRRGGAALRLARDVQRGPIAEIGRFKGGSTFIFVRGCRDGIELWSTTSTSRCDRTCPASSSTRSCAGARALRPRREGAPRRRGLTQGRAAVHGDRSSVRRRRPLLRRSARRLRPLGRARPARAGICSSTTPSTGRLRQHVSGSGAARRRSRSDRGSAAAAQARSRTSSAT